VISYILSKVYIIKAAILKSILSTQFIYKRNSSLNYDRMTKTFKYSGKVVIVSERGR